jgi:hypothetical protein
VLANLLVKLLRTFFVMHENAIVMILLPTIPFTPVSHDQKIVSLKFTSSAESSLISDLPCSAESFSRGLGGCCYYLIEKKITQAGKQSDSR